MTDTEARYFAVLKRIAAYDSPEKLRRHSQTWCGLDYLEALEMAYDNIRNEARMATKGKRRPKLKATDEKPRGANEPVRQIVQPKK